MSEHDNVTSLFAHRTAALEREMLEALQGLPPEEIERWEQEHADRVEDRIAATNEAWALVRSENLLAELGETQVMVAGILACTLTLMSWTSMVVTLALVGLSFGIHWRMTERKLECLREAVVSLLQTEDPEVVRRRITHVRSLFHMHLNELPVIGIVFYCVTSTVVAGLVVASSPDLAHPWAHAARIVGPSVVAGVLANVAYAMRLRDSSMDAVITAVLDGSHWLHDVGHDAPPLGRFARRLEPLRQRIHALLRRIEVAPDRSYIVIQVPMVILAAVAVTVVGATISDGGRGLAVVTQVLVFTGIASIVASHAMRVVVADVRSATRSDRLEDHKSFTRREVKRALFS